MVLLSKLCCKVQAITDIIIGFLGRKRNIVRNVSVFREGRGGEWCLGAFRMKRWHYVLFRDFSQKTIEVFKTCWSLLYSAIEQTHCARMWFFMSGSLFTARFWIQPMWCTYNAVLETCQMDVFSLANTEICSSSFVTPDSDFHGALHSLHIRYVQSVPSFEGMMERQPFKIVGHFNPQEAVGKG